VDLFDEPKALGFELRDGTFAYDHYLTIVNKGSIEDFLFLRRSCSAKGSGRKLCADAYCRGILDFAMSGTVLCAERQD